MEPKAGNREAYIVHKYLYDDTQTERSCLKQMAWPKSESRPCSRMGTSKYQQRCDSRDFVLPWGQPTKVYIFPWLHSVANASIARRG